MEEEYVEVKRPIKDIKDIKDIIQEMNIMVYRLPNFKDIKDIKNRNEGFYILANKNNISKHLKKTKFCNIFIQEGKCSRKVCNFAHSMEEYNFPCCAFGDNCKVKKCRFKHPFENLNEYKVRINFKLPDNIK
jgi:hypothetical protein